MSEITQDDYLELLEHNKKHASNGVSFGDKYTDLPSNVNTDTQPVSDYERPYIREDIEHWQVRSGGRVDTKLHLDCGSGRLCEQKPLDLTPKPVEAYPEGWGDICKNCLVRWRRGER